MHRLALTAGFLLLALPAAAQEVTECDRLAAGQFDDNRIADYTRLADMDPERSLAACLEAVASDPDNLRLQYQLARAHEVSGHNEDAFRIYLAGAEAGYPASMNGVARFYLDGRGTAVDTDRAVDWFGQAAMRGDLAAIFNLGDLYENGTKGVRMDKATAILWYTMAAERDYAAAQSEVAFAYATGTAVAVDMPLAVSWWERADALDEPSAPYNLGFVYESGFIGAPDMKRAARYYYRSLTLGYPNSVESFAEAPGDNPPELWREMETLLKANGAAITPDGKPDAKTIAAMAALGGFNADDLVRRFEAAFAPPGTSRN